MRDQKDEAPLREKDGDESGHDDGADYESSHDGADDVVFKEKPVSTAGFMDWLHMWMCIKVFFNPDIHVHDTANARHLWANFMIATGFIDYQGEVRWIVDVFFQHDLDEEKRRATMSAPHAQAHLLLILKRMPVGPSARQSPTSYTLVPSGRSR
jgi:hypothetical protein